MVTRSKKCKLEEIAGGASEGRRPLTKRKRVPEYALLEFLEREIHHGHLNEKKRVRGSRTRKSLSGSPRVASTMDSS